MTQALGGRCGGAVGDVGCEEGCDEDPCYAADESAPVSASTYAICA